MMLNIANKRIVLANTFRIYKLTNTTCLSNCLSCVASLSRQHPNSSVHSGKRLPLKIYFPMAASSSHSSSSSSLKANLLILEKSPYLQQHAHNPVNWYPWGPDAFRKAKAENKLIFLSIGYSTCHWCHVMERETFENVEVAQVLNKYYVSIKVDREERPDVDRVYMKYVQRTTNSGGWPLNVILTPTLEPLFGGTYFPPRDAHGRIGFKSLILLIKSQWQEQHQILTQEAKDSMMLIKDQVESKLGSIKNSKVPEPTCSQKCYRQLCLGYDPDFGGFSRAPKFPQSVILNFLLTKYKGAQVDNDEDKSLEMCLTTLKCMAYGGIHDHVGSGFSRYAVDRKWQVPHFEKMLYDQALLAFNYLDAFLIKKDQFYADIAHDILKFVARDMSDKEGGFYSAIDADSLPSEQDKAKREGAFYVWHYSELTELITDAVDLDIFSYHFNVKPEGNVEPTLDFHGELSDKNVLACFGSYEETAAHFNIPLDKVKDKIRRALDKLYKRRITRPRPSTDTKILTAWNGLMIAGFAKAGFVFNRSDYIEVALKAATFIKKTLTDESGGLIRCCYSECGQITQSVTEIPGFLEDYAFLVRGLIYLYEATLDGQWLAWAEELQDLQNEKFWDPKNGGYFNHEGSALFTLYREKDEQDGAEPCGNSVAISNMLRLYHYLDRRDFLERSEIILKAYAPFLNSIPLALPEMVSGALLYHGAPTQVFIAGDRDSADTNELLNVVRSNYLTCGIIGIADGANGKSGLLYKRHKILPSIQKVKKKAAAYICRDFTCSLPVTDSTRLVELLQKNLVVQQPSTSGSAKSDKY